LIFLPGIGSDGRSFFRQTPLAHAGRLAFFDTPLDVPEAPYNFDILALLLRDAVFQLCDKPPVLLGASFGGMMALTYALTWPDALSGLVLCGSSPDARWLPFPFLELGANLMSRVPAGLYRATAPSLGRLSGFRDAQNREGRDLFAQQTADLGAGPYARRVRAVSRLRLADRLGEVEVPTLLLHGTRDQTVPVRNSQRMSRRMPNATLHLLRGGRHNLYLNATAWFNTHVMDWLRQHHLP
jgi:pimeloyl-ACP methyl ester carboxylesterase